MPVITLTSDIGLQDYLVGAIKSIIGQACPGAQTIDISHQITPFHFPQAAYLCKSAIPHFEPGTCHFILINLFDTRMDHFLVVPYHGQYLFCADNGLLTMILETPPQGIQVPWEGGIIQVVRRFAETAAQIHKGAGLSTLGKPGSATVVRNNLVPAIRNNQMEGQIIYVDRFENVVANITREQFEEQRQGREFRITILRNEYISQISATYSDVAEGRMLALFNTAGYLEIAINKGNAAGLFGMQSATGGEPVKDDFFRNRLFYQSIRVEFL